MVLDRGEGAWLVPGPHREVSVYKMCAALAVFLLTACGGNDVDDYNRSHPVIAGSFKHAFSSLHNSPRAGACEQRFASLHETLATELDARRDALARTAKEGTSSGRSSPWDKTLGAHHQGL